MTQFASEPFTAADTTTLGSMPNWTKHPATDFGDSVIASNRAYANGGSLYYYHSGVPASADYSVSIDVVFVSNSGSPNGASVLARLNRQENTYYGANIRESLAGQPNYARLILSKVIAGVATTLGQTSAFTANVNDVVTIKIEVIGTSIKAYQNGIEVLSATDSGISAAGRCGIFQFASFTSPTDGYHIDNLSGNDISSGAPSIAGSASSSGSGIAAPGISIGL